MMSPLTIEDVLLRIAANLHLSKETELEMLTEIRTHLEEAVADALSKGADEQTALLKAAEQFGVEEAAAAPHPPGLLDYCCDCVDHSRTVVPAQALCPGRLDLLVAADGDLRHFPSINHW
jgi:hypothetical protein